MLKNEFKNGYVSQTQSPILKQPKSVKTANHAKISTKIVSDTPGRLRLRIAQKNRKSNDIQKTVAALEAHPNITQVQTNISQGSITIRHEGEDSYENTIAALKDLGIIFGDIGDGKSEAAAEVSNAVVDLNKRVRESTDGLVDLRFLFPLGLGCLSIRQLMIKGLQFDIIPWYVLAWYSFDSFLKLHAASSGLKGVGSRE
jgi:Heavy metal associated domain 2